MHDTNNTTPVNVSADAERELTRRMREWSGWADARLVIGAPPATVSPFAMTDFNRREFTVNVDALLRNPNRVLNRVTDFRLRQEAILTGAMLHEAGHARFTQWVPRSKEELAKLRHSDGSKVTAQELAFARLLEEPRIEGWVWREATELGCDHVKWTMPVTAAALLPISKLSDDPNQQIMDVIQSWVLRAGRAEAIRRDIIIDPKEMWEAHLTQVLQEALTQHFTDQDPMSVGGGRGPATRTRAVMDALVAAIRSGIHTRSAGKLAAARDILNELFPETPVEDMPTPKGGTCGESGDSGEGDSPESGDSGDSGEGDSPESGDSGEGDSPESGDSGEGDSPESGDSGDSGEGDSPESGDSGEGDSPESGEGDSGEGDSGEGSALTETEQVMKDLDEQRRANLEKSLAAAEGGFNREITKLEKREAADAGGNVMADEDRAAGFRPPRASDREMQREAEGFLRSMLSPSESNNLSLSESPSSTVDAAAMSAWRSAGGKRDPRFFVRSQRVTAPAPPIKIAVLVDISGSMEALQAPSALMSWALSTAAEDMRNFAGRGAQIETTLIHWGSFVQTVCKNGDTLPGIREVPCTQGTSALRHAMRAAETEIPGIFDAPETPENRLLVLFTDWELSFLGGDEARAAVGDALSNGVNLLSVKPDVPYSKFSKMAAERYREMVLRASASETRGKEATVVYDPNNPSQVWSEAERLLRG